MATAKTLKVILKGDDWTFSHKFLVYGDIKLEREDPVVQECIVNATKCLTVTAEDEEVRCSMISK